MSRILLVEDDPDVLPIFKEILLDAGHQVDTAERFRAAGDLLASREYDLVVSDGRLPDGTGMMLADKAKAKGIPCLIVTGYLHDLRDSHPGVDFDQYAVLRKPVRSDVLLAAVGRMASGG
jgi:two-component system, NtrC family, response regulator HydG